MKTNVRVNGAGIWIAVISACLAFSSCSTEVQLNAPYDSIPVVYGLLEMDADTQWVKINRTWLGDGDQYEFAAIRDSSEYPAGSVEGKIVEFLPSSSGGSGGSILPTGREWVLRDTTVDNRQPGAFAYPEQRLYFASTAQQPLDEEMLYELQLSLPDGKSVRAITSLVESGEGAISRPPNLPTYRLSLANVVSDGTATYNNVKLKWTTSAGASLYTSSIVVHYDEHYFADDDLTVLDSTRAREMRIQVGTRVAGNLNGGELMEDVFNGERFFTELATRLEANPRIRRSLGTYDPVDQIERAVDVVLEVANSDLAIYLDVHGSSNSIVQERPLWTNVELIDVDGESRGAIGLWASRGTQGVYGLGYSKQTIQHLQEGNATAALNFCSPSPLSDYACD